MRCHSRSRAAAAAAVVTTAIWLSALATGAHADGGSISFVGPAPDNVSAGQGPGTGYTLPSDSSTTIPGGVPSDLNVSVPTQGASPSPTQGGGIPSAVASGPLGTGLASAHSGSTPDQGSQTLPSAGTGGTTDTGERRDFAPDPMEGIGLRVPTSSGMLRLLPVALPSSQGVAFRTSPSIRSARAQLNIAAVQATAEGSAHGVLAATQRLQDTFRAAAVLALPPSAQSRVASQLRSPRIDSAAEGHVRAAADALVRRDLLISLRHSGLTSDQAKSLITGLLSNDRAGVNALLIQLSTAL